jgi:2-polyprenyl-3-methyl-5-hydroxy-6-metoxy-1,4-benzoquinol methylase
MNHPNPPKPVTQRHRYEYPVDLENANAAAANVVGFVGHGKRVLELGSGPGSITRPLKEINGCRVVAIEVDAEAARRVAPYCEQVLPADLNRPGWPERACANGKFDVVVAADVLEHLADPEAVLEGMVGALRDDGYIVLSLPHAGHNAVIASLLNGDVAYTDHGLLDRTHIRFFGLHNVQALIDGAGLKIVNAHLVSRPPELTELASQWARLAPQMRTALAANRFGGIYQVVVKATRCTAPGTALRLADLPMPDPRGTRFQRAAGSVWSLLGRHLSADARRAVTRWVKRIGVRV